MAVSPTQRTLKKLRDEGYVCAIVEHWNPFVKIRQDLFGFIDILGLKENEIVGVQSTTGAHFAERIGKIKEHKNYEAVKKSGIIIKVHGWRTLKGKWQCNETTL